MRTRRPLDRVVNGMNGDKYGLAHLAPVDLKLAAVGLLDPFARYHDVIIAHRNPIEFHHTVIGCKVIRHGLAARAIHQAHAQLLSGWAFIRIDDVHVKIASLRGITASLKVRFDHQGQKNHEGAEKAVLHNSPQNRASSTRNIFQVAYARGFSKSTVERCRLALHRVAGPEFGRSYRAIVAGCSAARFRSDSLYGARATP